MNSSNKRINVSLRQVEIFLAVAQTLSFSEAAKLCHLSQPALSANVKRLEEAVGARLFERHTRKVGLTAVGLEFHTVASMLTDNMHMSLARIADVVSGRRGRLVLAAAPSIAASFVPDLLARYLKQHPDIEVELRDELSKDCVKLVRDGVADVALAPLEAGASDLMQQQLFRDSLVLLCPSDHPLASYPNVRWRDLRPYPRVLMSQASNVRQLVDAEFARYGSPLRPAYEVRHLGTMLGLIAANLGIGELPRSLIQNLAMTGLVARPIINSAAHRPICAITLKGRSQTPTLAEFLGLCRLRAKEGNPAHSTAPRSRAIRPSPAAVSG